MAKEDSKKMRLPRFNLRLGTINAIIIAMAIVMALLLIYTDLTISTAYKALDLANEKYIACKKSADDVSDASDYLTNNAREFVMTGNLENLENYFTEVNVTRRRQNGEEMLAKYLEDPSYISFISSAVNISTQLEQREYYAFHLFIMALEEMDQDERINRFNVADISEYDEYLEKIYQTKIISTDRALSPDEKINVAREMLFDDIYSAAKNRMMDSIEVYRSALLEATDKHRKERHNEFDYFRVQQRILTIVIIVLMIGEILIVIRLIIVPLQRDAALIMHQKKIPISGFHEIKMLAMNYNSIVDQNKVKTEQLIYDATHDSLTRVNNRVVFEDIYNNKGTTEGVACIIADIDHFKGINDKYGHDVGDRVLQRVASLLQGCFRSDDIICRLGGDEFAVILYNVTAHSKALLRNKFSFISDSLAKPNDDLPPVYISMGVAFGNEKYTMKDLHKHADVVLYKVKNGGRNDIGFYE